MALVQLGLTHSIKTTSQSFSNLFVYFRCVDQLLLGLRDVYGDDGSLSGIERPEMEQIHTRIPIEV